MIPIEKIRSLKHLVAHEACPDGTASAMFLKYCLPNLHVQFVQYDTKAHRRIKVRPDMIFADFSPHPDTVKEFVYAEAVVLDHHKTTEPVVSAFGELGVFGNEVTDPGVCGATLAFREVCMPLLAVNYPDADLKPLFRQMEDYAALAGIRDTWQHNNPRWQQACEQAAALEFWPTDMLLGLPFTEWHEKMAIGSVIFQKKLDTAKRFGDNAFRFTSEKGTKVAVFEGVRMASDVAEYLDKEVDLAIGFGIILTDGEPSMVFSTRSHTFYDCRKFAEAHGGGGHTKSAGFRIPLKLDDPHPFALARRVVEDYEWDP